MRNAARALRNAAGDQAEPLSTMLQHALTRIKTVADAAPFFRPVEVLSFPFPSLGHPGGSQWVGHDPHRVR